MKRPTLESRRERGPCTACATYRDLTDGGLVKLHKRHGKTCDGSLLPPKRPKPRATDEWAAARRSTLERDDHRCRKCLASTDLEVHHIKERAHGGTNDLANLITLCGNCHCEWTFCEPPGMAFNAWRQLPPARWIVPLFAKEWPTDVSASAFKEQILNTIAMLMVQRDQRSGR